MRNPWWIQDIIRMLVAPFFYRRHSSVIVGCRISRWKDFLPRSLVTIPFVGAFVRPMAFKQLSNYTTRSFKHRHVTMLRRRGVGSNAVQLKRRWSVNHHHKEVYLNFSGARSFSNDRLSLRRQMVVLNGLKESNPQKPGEARTLPETRHHLGTVFVEHAPARMLPFLSHSTALPNVFPSSSTSPAATHAISSTLRSKYIFIPRRLSTCRSYGSHANNSHTDNRRRSLHHNAEEKPSNGVANGTVHEKASDKSIGEKEAVPWHRQLYTIPNLLTFVRIGLTPALCYLIVTNSVRASSPIPSFVLSLFI